MLSVSNRSAKMAVDSKMKREAGSASFDITAALVREMK